MTITLDPDIEEALAKKARQQGTTPEALVLETLRTKLLRSDLPSQLPFQGPDEWEAMVLRIGRDCGVSLAHEAVSSEGLYE